jgi:hypothetical protein
MPLHPVQKAAVARQAGRQMRFQILFTGGTIEMVIGLATGNSGWGWFIRGLTMRIAVCCAWMCTMAWLPGAEVPSFAERAERAFREAQQSVRADRTNLTALIHLARSAFDRAEFARNNDERAEVATHGADAAREAIHLAPTNAAAHYWLAMNFGQLARTKTLGALHLVRRMEEEFLRARELDPRVDFAGPDRSLGLLYRDAPGIWRTPSRWLLNFRTTNSRSSRRMTSGARRKTSRRN